MRFVRRSLGPGAAIGLNCGLVCSVGLRGRVSSCRAAGRISSQNFLFSTTERRVNIDEMVVRKLPEWVQKR